MAKNLVQRLSPLPNVPYLAVVPSLFWMVPKPRMTSRKSSPSEAAVPFWLPLESSPAEKVLTPLSLDDSIALLKNIGGDYACNRESCTDISKALDGLPLAVWIAGRYLAEAGIESVEYAAWLKENPISMLSLMHDLVQNNTGPLPASPVPSTITGRSHLSSQS